MIKKFLEALTSGNFFDAIFYLIISGIQRNLENAFILKGFTATERDRFHPAVADTVGGEGYHLMRFPQGVPCTCAVVVAEWALLAAVVRQVDGQQLNHFLLV